jgi:hypothetical protein
VDNTAHYSYTGRSPKSAHATTAPYTAAHTIPSAARQPEECFDILAADDGSTVLSRGTMREVLRADRSVRLRFGSTCSASTVCGLSH